MLLEAEIIDSVFYVCHRDYIYIYTMWVFNCHVFKRPTTGRLTLTIGYMDGETPPASRASINLDTWPI